ncbi:methyltransferase domain-containing protein [Spelaeicoccus albus]|uniref:Trans-aconitate 2-methyltransferase n=1 Tax=Spelaeicoccus albus TaxID=1280376 RepID=A0A7Z0IHY1_9MICO|nr:methyltransferase domain-containing protein [Spelaeicoccus albus]NYI68073.1 trans-aconitate 2-methyltransferase [Spelaeicoccus albus]
MRWNPDSYHEFDAERSRPFHDLIGAVATHYPDFRPRSIVDLGCGSGELTAQLGAKWPEARVLGIDSSPEMIDRTSAHESAQVNFSLDSIEDFTPPPGLDLLVSNAALQWVPGHPALLDGWMAAMGPGSVLAVQVPGNFRAPSHSLMREIANSGDFAAELAGVLRSGDVVAEPGDYLHRLADAGLAPTVWETTYLQVLAGENPVLDWVRGTALRPVLAALSAERAAEFERVYGAALQRAYPPTRHGTVFKFRRIFFIGRHAS